MPPHRSLFPLRFAGLKRPRFAESVFWLASGGILVLWALFIAADLLPFLRSATSVQLVLLKHSGAAALLISLLLLSVCSLVASVWALRSKPILQSSASVLLITVCALRAVQILSDSSVTVMDANVLGGLFLATAVLYHGPARLWWLIMMPLATIAAFLPLVWLEYFKGAPTRTLVEALIVPSSTFAAASILILVRELRSRACLNVTELRQLRSRGESSMQSLRSMEAEMKKLKASLTLPETNVPAPLTQTIEFLSVQKEATETCSFDEIETLMRQLLEDARGTLQASKLRLTFTSPIGGHLPIAVRGSLSTISVWMKSSLSLSLDALGGFPGGVVRVNLSAGLSTVALSVEDNGRGIGEAAEAQRHLEGQLNHQDIRKGVESVGGRFDLQARLGVGARLTIELPRVDAFATLPRASLANRGYQKSAATVSTDFDRSMSSSPRA